MEVRVAVGTTVVIAAACLLAGGGLGFGLARGLAKPSEAPSTTITATGDAIEGSVDKATESERIRASADAEAKVAIARMESTTIYAQAVVDLDCAPLTAAMAELAQTAAASMVEGSAANNVEEAQQDVSKVVNALLTNPDVCPRSTVPQEP